jgi:hypothetical protein
MRGKIERTLSNSVILGTVKNLGYLWIFLALTLTVTFIAYHLQQNAFPKSGASAGQISVTVYTRLSPSRLSLKSTVYPNAPQDDKLDVTVTGPRALSDPWILVVQCPSQPGASSRNTVRLYEESASGKQSEGNAIVSVRARRHWRGLLGCYQGSEMNPGLVKGQNINVTLPVLEQNPSAQSAPKDTPLYVERQEASKKIADLVEVLQAPGSICPSSESSSNPSQSARPSASPVVSTATPAEKGPSPSSSPSNSSPTPGALGPACYKQVDSGTIATQYGFPASVATSETLKNVDLGDDRIDSMFPPGQITSDYRIIWQGVSGLSPSLSATNLSTAESASEATFFAGVFYGLGAGFLVPFFQGFPDAIDRARSDRRASKHTPGM